MRCWFSLAALGLIGSNAQELLAPPVLDTHLDSSLVRDVESEAHDFRAETGRLMDIIINSLYTERDVFLRELVSNAADAVEKLRVRALKDPQIFSDDDPATRELNIFIKLDKPRGEISIIDTGIGMTKQELASNLGTVAKSGTQQFIEAAQRGASASNLIGQFGVGFYSAYLVADEITVVSKSPYDKKQWVWQSTSQQGGFKIFEDPRPQQLARGTIVTLKLKADAQRFLSKSELRRLGKRFSNFVPFPLYLGEVTDSDDEVTWLRINSDKPLWLQDKSEIDREQYESFYRNMTGDKTPPLTWTHFKAEGDIEFSALMYIPGGLREDQLMPESVQDPDASLVKLYVQRVLISDRLRDFFPGWLSFVKGVVDSNDLPLKVDRETFSNNRVMKTIKKKTISKVLDTLRVMSRDGDLEEDDVNTFMEENPLVQSESDLKQNKELLKTMKDAENRYHKYFGFSKVWENFGGSLMAGCIEGASASDRPKLLGLLRAKSNTRRAPTSLDGYISRMKPGQKHIYYITGDDMELLKASPYMEYFELQNIEVLYLLGTFEEGCLNRQKDYKGHQFRSIERDSFDDDEFAFLKAGADIVKQKEVTAAADREHRAIALYYKPLTDWVAEALGMINAQYVTISKTLVQSPAKVSSPAHGFTAATERMARTTLNANKMMVEAFAKMKTFELNPTHWLIHKLLEDVKFQNAHETQDLALQREVNMTIDLIYESALIASGFPCRRPHVVTQSLYGLMAVTRSSDKEGPERFQLSIPPDVYVQVDRELKTKAAKEKLKESQSGDVDEQDDEDDYQELFDHDEL